MVFKNISNPNVGAKHYTVKKDYYFISAKYCDIGIKRYANIVNFKNSPILFRKKYKF